MKNIIAFLFTLALIGAGWFVLGPYRTVQKLTYALENEDPVAVDQYVNFDAVRASLRSDFLLGLGGKADGIANNLSGAFLSMLVSPQAMVMVFKDQSRRDDMGLSMNIFGLLGRGRWVNTSTFVLKNSGDEPTMLLNRIGNHWNVTGLRLK